VTGAWRWLGRRALAVVVAVAGAAVVVVVLATAAEAQPEPLAQAQAGPEATAAATDPAVDPLAAPDAESHVDTEITCPGSGVLGTGFLAEDETVRLVFTANMPQEWADLYVRQAAAEAKEGNCRLARWAPSGHCARDSTPPDQALPTNGCWSRYPAANYNVTYDQGPFLDLWRKIWGFLAAFTFYVGRWWAQTGMWMIGVGFKFDITQYTEVVNSIAGRYDARIVGPFGLHEFAWFALFAFVAINMLRRRMGVAGGELFLSMLLAAVAGFLVANADLYMNSVVDFMDRTSTALLVAARDEDPSDEASPGGDPSEATRTAAAAAVHDLQNVLYTQFVEVSYYLVNWGEVPQGPDGVCARRADFVLSVGLADDGGWGARYMRDENGAPGADAESCAGAVSWNSSAGPDTFGAAMLTTITNATMGTFVVLTAMTLFVGKLIVAAMFAILPIAAALAVLPGSSRRLAWGWAATTLQGVLVFAGSAAVLSAGGLAIAGVMRQAPASDPWSRTLPLFSVFVILLVLRRRLLAGAQTAASTFADHMTRLSPASANWQGGTTGLNLSSLLRADRAVVAPVAGAGFAAARMWRAAMHRRRAQYAARLSLRNLENMERQRELPKLEYKHDTRPSATAITLKGKGTATGTTSGPSGGGLPWPLGKKKGSSSSSSSSSSKSQYELEGEQLPSSGGRYPNVVMSRRAPSSFRPTASEVLLPWRWGRLVGRQGQAFASRFRQTTAEHAYERMVRSSLDSHEIAKLGIRDRRNWQIGPQHGLRASDFVNLRRRSQRGFDRVTGARESFQRQYFGRGGASKWRRGNQ
jgi:hypothetical protein